MDQAEVTGFTGNSNTSRSVWQRGLFCVALIFDLDEYAGRCAQSFEVAINLIAISLSRPRVGD